MSDTPAGKSPETPAPSLRNDRQRIFDTVMQLITAEDSRLAGAKRYSIGPDLLQLGLPARQPADIALVMPAPAGWPADPMPATPLRPVAGWGSAAEADASRSVVAVALFGLDAPAIRTALEQIASQQLRIGDFVPVFFIDTPHHTPFRRRGYMVEYFPRPAPGKLWSLAAFQERFSLAWHKWGASALIDFSAGDILAPLVKGLGFTEPRPQRDPSERDWSRPAPGFPRPPSADIAALKAETAARGLDREPDSFVFYRIIGNDLYPRHERGQSVRNLRFILEHEAPLANCEKRYVVNRIMDRDDEAAIIGLLEAAGQPYLHLPFEWDAYAAAGWDFSTLPGPDFVVLEQMAGLSQRQRMRVETAMRRLKNIYAMNNNGARNAALEDGRGRAKWVLPWDGNCFITPAAWADIEAAARQQGYAQYVEVPMARLKDNAVLFDPGFAPAAVDEPQVMFRRDAEERFDERFPYGRRPKVEFFWRLGVPGPWDLSLDDVWDLPRPALSEAAGQVVRAGWVARLSSGMAELESDSKLSQAGREIARNEAIIATLDELDERVLRRRFDATRLTSYSDAALDRLAPDAPLVAQLRAEAEAALGRGPYSVLDKTALPPSGDPHDYWHPAPFWWPNPATLDGLPYVRRDGERVPGTLLYEPGSENYDRTRLQRMFDDTIVLALAARATGEARFANHAARLVTTWFVDPQTRMAPHLRFAQVRPGHEDEEVQGFGLIESKDFYFMLDGARLLERSGALGAEAAVALRAWLRHFLDWLVDSPQGVAQRRARNNHGTCYDLQVMAIAAFLDDGAALRGTLRRAEARIADQFAADGAQPFEAVRAQPLHYACLNLQSWLNLARIASTLGTDLWQVSGPGGGSLARGIDWLLGGVALSPDGFADLGEFDMARLAPLVAAYRQHEGRDPAAAAAIPALAASPRPLYFPADGIKPFWLLEC